MVETIRHVKEEKVLIMDDLLELDRCRSRSTGILFSYALDILVCGDYVFSGTSRIALDRSCASSVANGSEGCIGYEGCTGAVRDWMNIG